MNPTPSPDTVEPTEADKALAEKLYLMEVPTFGAFADLIGQHVAAEVARETAELRARLFHHAQGMIRTSKVLGEPPRQQDLDDLALATARKFTPTT